MIGVSRCLQCKDLHVLDEGMASDDGSPCCRGQANIGAEDWIVSAHTLIIRVVCITSVHGSEAHRIGLCEAVSERHGFWLVKGPVLSVVGTARGEVSGCTNRTPDGEETSRDRSGSHPFGESMHGEVGIVAC